MHTVLHPYKLGRQALRHAPAVPANAHRSTTTGATLNWMVRAVTAAEAVSACKSTQGQK
jgi:hypothetical protein